MSNNVTHLVLDRSSHRVYPVLGAGETEFVVVTESGVNSSLPAPKAKATVAGMWVTRFPSDQALATSSFVSPVVDGSDGLITTGGSAYRALTFAQPIPLPGAGALVYRRGTPTSIIARRCGGRLISQPRKESNGVSQVESRTYRIATAVRTARRRHLRIASRDGVIDAEENALTNALVAIEEELEAKADDERAGLALIRAGRTKHTRGIVVDLFPSIGPEAA